MEGTRVAVLWDHVTGYLGACILALRQAGASVLVVQRSSGSTSHDPFTFSESSGVEFIDLAASSTSAASALAKRIAAFSPDVLIAPRDKWGLYCRIARCCQAKGGFVIGCSDNYWKGHWRDYANALLGRLGVFHPYDALLVPGSLGRVYARRTGFSDDQIFQGLYSCDVDRFRPVGQRRDYRSEHWPRRFLFVGQYVVRKGVDILLSAYARYRTSVQDPWELWCVGAGPLESSVREQDGVSNLGFLAPEELSGTMMLAGCLVLPSRHDHWPLIVHEATCAGLPIVATCTCGSCAELVEDGYNGYMVPAGDVERLAWALTRISSDESTAGMGAHSFALSSRFSPELWASRILCEMQDVMMDRNALKDDLPPKN